MIKIDENIKDRINSWKKSLLDMTKRNRLLWYKPYRIGTVKLEKKYFDDDIFDILDLINNLAYNGKTIEFIVDTDKAIKESNSEKIISEEEMKIVSANEEIIKERSKSLANILKRIRLENEEKGLNIGYIATGFLRWYERDDAVSEIKSPLIMIPVKIEQAGRKEPFKLSLNSDEEITINPVIKKKLEIDFNIILNLNNQDASDEVSIKKTIENIKNQIEKVNNWQVVEEAVIDTFNFQNLAIWSDLDKNKELIMDNAFSKVLAGSELKDEDFYYEEGEPDLDKINQEKNNNIYEVDSSQQEAIYRTRNGESFVIQGPPGTGKSQTITNIIAESLYHGKKVLFVSEKQAALDVVYHKLEKKGLSDFCLILHNSKQRKTNVREQIEKSLQLSSEKISVAESELRKYNDFDDIKEKLNMYNQELHRSFSNGITPFFLFGELNKLWNVPNLVFSLPKNFNWNCDYHAEMSNIFLRVDKYGKSFIDNNKYFQDNYWKYYTAEFCNSTRREVQEVIGEINNNILDKKVAEILDLINEENYIKAMSSIDDYIKMIDKIPFEQAKHIKLSNEIDEIVLNKNKQKNIIKKNKELETSIETDKNELLINFSQDFLEVKKVEDYHKKLTNKYSSIFSRLSGDYKKIKNELNEYALNKVNYNDYVKNLNILININNNKKILNKNIESLELLEKGIVKMYYLLKDLIVDKNNLIKDLLYKLDFETLQEYQNYYIEKNMLLNDYKLDDFIEKIENTNEVYNADMIANIYKKRFLTIFLEKSDFDKKFSNYYFQNHNDDISIFKKYDEKILDISAARVRCELINKLPTFGFTNDIKGGEMKLLQRELKKKSRLMPTRKLIENLPVLLPQLKPCMMMSPLTVSSYFGTNPNWKFDIVIFDEASQVKPEYAITSIIRGNQVIVAGDSKQMPPTNFFDASYDDEEYIEEFDEDHIQLDNLESILDEMSSVFPDVYLNWHYRSRDESLIAFSNHHFYNSRLATFPSPNKDNDIIGVKHVYCEDGVWDSKNGNKIEAEKVALLVFEHIKQYPNQSLGIVSFGKSQQFAIEDAINKLRDVYPEYEEFFSDAIHEPFFVKNLENVQGDERDKIILSCGYGKDAKGVFAMRFGPLAMAGGERRLNVAVSRARNSMIIVSSFKANEIRDVEKNPQRKLIRDFIDYAEHGIVSLLGENENVDSNSNPIFDSGFEEDVYDFLINKGYKLRTQVGSSGYKIDIVVKHPEITNRYILAIECDGATYHSSRTARDRDILRQKVLENLGWKFYRIWSTNWFHDNESEKTRLITAIENAINNYNVIDNKLEEESEIEKIVIEEKYENSDEELSDIYYSWNVSLKKKFGTGTYGYNGWSNNNGWNSLYIMKNYDVIEKILEQVLIYKCGYSPEDVFREINEKVFEKNRYTEQVKTIYEETFRNKFINKNKVEIINNTIKVK